MTLTANIIAQIPTRFKLHECAATEHRNGMSCVAFVRSPCDMAYLAATDGRVLVRFNLGLPWAIGLCDIQDDETRLIHRETYRMVATGGGKNNRVVLEKSGEVYNPQNGRFGHFATDQAGVRHFPNVFSFDFIAPDSSQSDWIVVDPWTDTDEIAHTDAEGNVTKRTPIVKFLHGPTHVRFDVRNLQKLAKAMGLSRGECLLMMPHTEHEADSCVWHAKATNEPEVSGCIMPVTVG